MTLQHGNSESKPLADWFTFSLVTRGADNQPQLIEVPWESFVKNHEQPDVRKLKDGPALILATFDGKGRKDENVLSITGIGLDLDEGNLSQETIAEKLNGYRYVAHTTWRSTPSNRRWRVILPFTQAVAPTKLLTAFNQLNAVFGGMLDSSCTNASRLLFVASCPPEARLDYEFFAVDGERFDASALPAAPPPPAPAASTPDLDAPSEATVRKALTYLSPDMPYDKGWLRVGMALHDWDSVRGFPIWNEWSSKAVIREYPGEEVLLHDNWKTFKRKDGLKIKIGTLLKMAHQAGFIDFKPDPEFEPVEEPDDDENDLNIRSRPKPMRDEAFIGIAGEFVDLIFPQSEASREVLLTQFLTAFGTLRGMTPKYAHESDLHGTQEYLLVVGPTGQGRKGTSIGHIRRILKDAGRPLIHDCIVNTLSSGEGLIHLIRDPKATYTFDNKTKKSAITKYDPGVADKRLLVIAGEFGSILEQLRRAGNTLSPTLREAWDGQSLINPTRNEGKGGDKCTDPLVGVVGHITPEELRKKLQTADQFNGFGNRFLFAYSLRPKQLPEGGARPEGPAWDALVHRVRLALHTACDSRARRTDETRALWAEWYVKQPNLSGPALYLLSRREAHLLRLSLIYATLELGEQEEFVDVDPLDESKTELPEVLIEPRHHRAALAVLDYCVASTAYVFGEDASAADDRNKVLEVLKGESKPITLKVLRRKAFAGHKQADVLRRLLQAMEIGGLITVETERRSGRPTIWVSLRKVQSEQSEQVSEAPVARDQR